MTFSITCVSQFFLSGLCLSYGAHECVPRLGLYNKRMPYLGVETVQDSRMRSISLSPYGSLFSESYPSLKQVTLNLPSYTQPEFST